MTEYGKSEIEKLVPFLNAEQITRSFLGRPLPERKPKPKPEPVALLFVEVYPCSSCGGDLHADWTCPKCKAINLMAFWPTDEYSLPVDEVTDNCQNITCGALVKLHVIVEEPCFISDLEG